MSPPPVRWRFTPATTRPLRLLVYAAVGLVVGPVVGFVALVLWTLVSRGGVGVAVVALALALLVGLGVGSGRALFGLSGTQAHADVGALSRRGLVGSILTGAVLVVVGVRETGGAWLFVGCLVAEVAALVVSAALRSEGSVVPAENRVDYGGRTVPLDAIRDVRSVRVRRFVFALVRYRAGRVGPSVPRLLVLSTEGLKAMTSARGHDTPDESEGERASTAVRAVAGVFGVACLAAGPLLWLLLPAGDGRVVAAYLGGFGLLFGAVFLRYAVVA